MMHGNYWGDSWLWHGHMWSMWFGPITLLGFIAFVIYLIIRKRSEKK